MSYANMDAVPTQTAGTSELLASDWNTYVRDNFNSIKFGHVVCTSSTRPTGIAEGTMIYETDTNKVLVYNGSSWVEVSDLDSTDALSASGQTKLDNIGSVFISEASFSSVSSVSVDSVFSSSYINYRVLLSFDASANDFSLGMRLRASGSDNSTNSYSAQFSTASTTSVTANASDTTIFENVFVADDFRTGANAIGIDFFSPYTTARETSFFGMSYSSVRIFRVSAGNFSATTSFDGFSIIPNTGTVTGRYWVYGLKGT
jgi:hypothetical protein